MDKYDWGIACAAWTVAGLTVVSAAIHGQSNLAAWAATCIVNTIHIVYLKSTRLTSNEGQK